MEDQGKPQTRREFLVTAAVAGVAVATGCGGDDEPGGPTDAGPRDGGRRDGGPRDAGARDAGSDGGLDAGPPPVDPPEETSEGLNFPLGVASGDVTTERAVLWTRYDGLMTLRLTVWEMDGDAYARTVYDADVTPGDGGYVSEDAGGLVAGGRYRFVFFETDGEARLTRSPIGRFRAPPASDALVPLVLGAVSCTNQGHSMATLERAGERDDLDVFLFLGDTSYNDGAETLEEYRAKWVENMSTDGYRAVRRATSLLATWDDHEFENDWNPEAFDPAQLAAAKQAFFDHQPVRRDATSPDRIWKRMRWGRTVEIFVLDCRSERLPSTRTSDSPIYISREQMDWLKDGLAASDAVFKLIMSSVPISDFPGAFDFPSARNDRWEGYEAQREEILRFIDETAIGHVIWLSGDFHLGSMGRVSTSGPGSMQLEILAGPGAQTGNPLALTLGEPQFDWATSTNNYTALELDPAVPMLRAYFIDRDASVLEVGEYRF